jgi:hypothetical protein
MQQFSRGEGEACLPGSNGTAVMSEPHWLLPNICWSFNEKRETASRDLSEVDRLLKSGSSLERLPRRLIGTVEGSTRFGQRGHKRRP